MSNLDELIEHHKKSLDFYMRECKDMIKSDSHRENDSKFVQYDSYASYHRGAYNALVSLKEAGNETKEPAKID